MLFDFEISGAPGPAPAPALGGRDAGMARLAQRHQIIGVMGAAIRERNNVVNLGCRSNPALAPTYLT